MLVSSTEQHSGIFQKKIWDCWSCCCVIFFFFFRYSVKVTAPHITTVQVQTSKSDVFFKLQVLDNEEEIVSVTGKGHAVIPAFNFLSNETHLSSNGEYCIQYLTVLFTMAYIFLQ